MTLNLFLARRSTERKTVIFADPAALGNVPGVWRSAGGSLEPVLSGLASELNAVQRVMYPLPDDTTRRYIAPPPLVRSRHADLWHAISRKERESVLLVAGPTATYLAPVIGAEATALVVVRDPREAILPASGGWRSVLGPFPELDEVPEEAGSEAERDRWVDRIRQATSEVRLVRATDLAGITREVAAALALGPRVAERAAVAAMEVGGEADVSRHRVGPPQWLDEVLYALGMPPKQRRPKERRQPAAAEGPPGRYGKRAQKSVVVARPPLRSATCDPSRGGHGSLVRSRSKHSPQLPHGWARPRMILLCAVDRHPGLVGGMLAPTSASAVTLEPIGEFNLPMFVTSYPEDPDKLLVVERPGRVQLVEGGTRSVFLDATQLIGTIEESRACNRSRRRRTSPPAAGSTPSPLTASPAVIQIDEFTAAGDSVDLSTRRPVLTIEHSDRAGHYGGQMEFGPPDR